MNEETTSNEQVSQTETTPTDLGGLSFSDFERVRRGEALPSKESKTSAPAQETETKAKETTESETVEENEVDESEAEGGKDESTDSQDKPKQKKGGFQRRIDKLNSRLADKDRELEYLRQLALKSAGGEKPSSKEPEAKKDDSKPKADNYDSHGDYVEALTEWKADQKIKEFEEAQKSARIQNEQQGVFKNHSQRVQAFKEKMKDFDEVLESVDEITISPTVRELIVTSDNGPALMYELAKNPEEYEHICKLSPLAAAREVGKIETRLEKSKEPIKETKKLTSAPKPIETVGSGKGSVAKSIHDSDLSFADYERMRREQLRRKRA